MMRLSELALEEQLHANAIEEQQQQQNIHIACEGQLYLKVVFINL